MKYRFLHITTDYTDYLQSFYRTRPGLALQPFQRQQDELFADGFGWADFWSAAMTCLGHESYEIIANAEPLQLRWAWDQRLRVTRDWMQEIALAQLRSIQPDVIFFSDFVALDHAFVKRVRQELNSLRLVLGWCGAPGGSHAVFREYDAILSNIPEVVGDFIRRGHTAFLLRHAFEPRLLERMKPARGVQHEIAFIGLIGLSRSPHVSRSRLLAELLRELPLDIFGLVTRVTHARQLAGDWWDRWRRIASALGGHAPPRQSLTSQEESALCTACQPPRYGRDMFELLRDSKLALNAHIDLSRASASNMRLFEATGVGTCLMTDQKANLRELFEPDHELVTFSCADECVEKARYLLEHDSVRRAIAEAGQRRTLKEHTFTQRAVQLDDIVRQLLGKATSHRRRAA